MSNVEDLIQRLAPDGVDFVQMWKLTAWDKKFNAVDRAKQRVTHQYTYLLANELKDLAVETGGTIKLLGTGSDDFGWTTPEVAGDRVATAEIVAIPWGGNPSVQYYKGPFVTADNRIAVVLEPTVLETKFLYYVMLSRLDEIRTYYRGAGIQHPSMLKVLDMRIPVPPLEVQREIVRILDTFTELEVELEAEIGGRRRQYAFYSNELLTPGPDWRVTKVGEVAEIFDGPHATPKKVAAGPWYLSISSLANGRFDLDLSAHIGVDQFAAWTRRVNPRVGDTMFSYETRLGQAAYWNLDEPAALGRRMGLLRPIPSKVEPQFLTLAYLGPDFQAQIKAKTVRGATVERFPIANMADWTIWLPPLPEQRRIVEVLSAFDALVNDLHVGLPAEVIARRKQYEYYRDRLLTFDELPDE